MILGFLTSLINPYSFGIYTYAIKMLPATDITSQILEWQPMIKGSGIIEMLKVLILISPLMVTFISKRKLELVEFMLMIFAILMGFIYLRLYIYFIVIVLIFFSDTYIDALNVLYKQSGLKFEKIKSLKNSFLTIGIVVSLIVPIGMFISITTDFPTLDVIAKDKFPSIIVDYINENDIDTNSDLMLNSYNIGGYLIFKDKKVFIDGRCDPYVKEFSTVDIFREITHLINKASNKEIEEYFDKYDVKYILYEKTSRIVLYAKTSGNWEELISDNNYVLLKRIQK